MRHCPLVLVNLLFMALASGIWAASIFSLPFGILGAIAAGLFVWAFFLAVRESAHTAAILLLLFLFLGAWRLTGASQEISGDLEKLFGKEILVEGVLLEPLQERAANQGNIRQRALLGVQYIKDPDKGTVRTGRGKIYADFQRTEKEKLRAEAGDKLQLTGRMMPLQIYKNPGRMDQLSMARAQGIWGRVAVGKRDIHVTAQAAMTFKRFAERVRQHYLALMQEVMPSADAAAIFAMLFGGYEGIRPELIAAFSTTGIIHILSVSGSHMTLLAACLAGLGKIMHCPKGLQAGVVAAGLFFYSLLAGFSAPVLRSGIMGGLAFFAWAFDRESDARWLFALTGIGILLVSPYALFDISFQLSFGATAGLLYLAPVFRRRWFHDWPIVLAASMAVTLGAQWAVLPFLVYYFHQVSLSSFLANLFLVPLVEGMILGGLLAGLAGFWLPKAAQLIFLFDSLLLGLVYEGAAGLARLPGSSLWLPSGNAGAGLLYYAGTFFFLQERESRKAWIQRASAWSPLLLAVGVLFLGSIGYLRFRDVHEMKVHFIDVGQGDAALIVTPHGRAFMVDTGGIRESSFDLGERVDVPYLWHYGIRRLDYVFLTHAHEDHAAGLKGILSRVPVGKVFLSSEGREAYAHALGISPVSPAFRSFTVAKSGQKLVLDGVTIEVLYAPEALAGNAGGNETSNVIRVSYGGAAFLFTGDLIKEQEKILLQKGPLPFTTVLKVGHHGSRTSTSAEFLEAVRPQTAMLCVGAYNTFGHPHQEVMQRLSRQGIKIFRTDRDGAVVFHTDGKRMRIDTFVGGSSSCRAAECGEV